VSEHTIKLPDVGEGVAEAEVVEINVKIGDPVREGDALAAVMTDKATVEIPSPADGVVLWIGPEIGQKIAVGSEIIKLDLASGARVAKADEAPTAAPPSSPPQRTAADAGISTTPPRPPSATSAATSLATLPATRQLPSAPASPALKAPDRPLAAPSVRAYARDHGVDLRFIKGSGPGGRIVHKDIDSYLARPGLAAGAPANTGLAPNTEVEDIKIIGLRRRIAQRMQDTKRRIPHFSYVEEVDVTDLEALRADVNADKKSGRPRLTILPFIMRAMVMALRDFPQINARYDDESETLHRYGAAHIGIAVQTPNGLMVAVVRHAETRTIWDCAAELQRLSEAARAGTISRDELSGSTITITSLGALGGIVSTPIINAPEVAIVGVNKIAVRPVLRGTAFEPRKIMNLSSSFDHRIVDGWDAAEFIQRLRSLLEAPAKIFMEA